VSAFSFGVAVTMTIACFADSGTMTADFTRWAKNGTQGALAAFAGIWSYFSTWLNILGVLVQPIGVIIILDQVFASRRAPAGSGLYWKPFAACAIGAAIAPLTHLYAPQLSDTVVAMVTGGIAFTALTLLTGSTTTPTDYEAEEPALSGEAV
jgi:cytosine permease